MRICIIGDGRSIHIKRWIDFFIGRGHEVHVITDRPDPDSKAVSHRLRCPGSKLAYRVKGLQTKKHVASIKPDILHAHFAWGYGQFGAMADFHPFIVTVWGSDILSDARKSEDARKEIERTFGCADAVSCTAESMLATLRKEYSLGEKARLIRWGIDTKTFHRGYEREAAALREKLGIPEEAAIVLSPRGMQQVYGNHLLIEAAPEVVRMHPETYFTFIQGAGNPSYENTIKKRGAELGVSEKLRFVERHVRPEELAIYMNMASISTSFVPYGQFGAALLESMNCGCVILASDIPIHREKLTHMKNGLLVNASDSAEVASNICHVIEHPDIKEEFYRINSQMVDSTENMERNGLLTEKLYQELIELKKGKI